MTSQLYIGQSFGSFCACAKAGTAKRKASHKITINTAQRILFAFVIGGPFWQLVNRNNSCLGNDSWHSSLEMIRPNIHLISRVQAKEARNGKQNGHSRWHIA